MFIYKVREFDDMKKVKQKTIKTNLFIVSALFIFGFVPLIITYIISPYDITMYSLSRIGWQIGWQSDGMYYLWFFIGLSNIIQLYAVFLYIKQLSRKNLILAIVATLGRLFSAAGGLTPFRVIDPDWMINLHNQLVYIGIFINSCVMMFIVIQFCVFYLNKKSHRIIAGSAWGAVIAYLLVLFFTIGGVAAFQLSMSASFAIVLLCINWILFINRKQS